jgi:hypothetical protein
LSIIWFCSSRELFRSIPAPLLDAAEPVCNRPGGHEVESHPVPFAGQPTQRMRFLAIRFP